MFFMKSYARNVPCNSAARKRIMRDRVSCGDHPRAGADADDCEHRVGMRVPQTTQFYAVPETVAVEVAAIKADNSMVVNDRVVLLDPATSEVVAE
jgi:Protein of unknown function (DUF1236)